jgi:putative OmpL-like beta-barrel porin-2
MVMMLCAGVTPALAADPPADTKTRPETETAAPSPASLTTSMAGEAEATASQDPSSPAPGFLQSIEIYGLVDGYYGWAFNEVGPALRNFDINHNSFSLSYVEFAIAKPATEQSRAGFRADFGAGDTADLVNLFEPGGTNYLKYVQQAYVSYLVPAGKGLTVDFGKFVTPAGAEVIESKDNYNYSRGLLFALAIPYYHMGARFGYAATDKVSFTGYIVNGWNNVKDNNDAKSGAAQIAWKVLPALTVTQAWMGGPEGPDGAVGWRNLYDTIATWTVTPRVSLMANMDIGRDTYNGQTAAWHGVAAYGRFGILENWAITPRFEIFEDRDGFATGTAQTIREITVTSEHTLLKGLSLRVEYRRDWSTEDFFEYKTDEFRSNQNTILFGFVYALASP